MKAWLALGLTMIVLLGVGLAVATGSDNGASIYDRGVFLTLDTPDAPPDALQLLGRLQSVHDLNGLKAALAGGTKVIVYDCSASSLIEGGFLQDQLPSSFGIMAINVKGQDILEPKGCEPAAAGGPYATFYQQGIGCGGSSIARFNEGNLFKGFLERQLSTDGCSVAPTRPPVG